MEKIKKYGSDMKLLIVFELDSSIKTVLCKEKNGHALETKYFKERKQYKQYCKKLETNLKEDIKQMKIGPLWKKGWQKRYDLSEWKDAPSSLNDVHQILQQYTERCDDHSHVAQAPLFLLGTFLSGYTSEIFHDFDFRKNENNKARAIILDVPWTEGIEEPLEQAAKNLSFCLFDYLYRPPALSWRPRKIFSVEDGIRKMTDLDYAQPCWERRYTDDEYALQSDRFIPYHAEVVIGETKVNPEYRNAAVLIRQHTGLSILSVEKFLEYCPFCASVVLRKPKSTITVSEMLSINARKLVWFDEKFNDWTDMGKLLRDFLFYIFNDSKRSVPTLQDQWNQAENLIARYQEQKGVKRLTVIQRRT